MVRFQGWLAHLDVPTVDRRVLVLRDDLPTEPAMVSVPVFGPDLPRSVVGTLTELWVDETGWLRGAGEINLGALPPAYRPQPPHHRVPKLGVGAGVDVDVDDSSTVERGDDILLVINGWRLRGVKIGDLPAWPDARLELEL